MENRYLFYNILNNVLLLNENDFTILLNEYQLNPSDDKIINSFLIANSLMTEKINSENMNSNDTVDIKGVPYDIPKDCLKLGYYNIKRSIGYGTYGSIIEITDKRDPKQSLVFKIMKLYNFELKKQFIREILMHRYVQKFKICPMLYNWWMCENSKYGIMVIQQMKGDLFSLYKQGKQEISSKELDKLLYGLINIHSMGIAHLDIKMSNILYQTKESKENNYELYFSDFGLTNSIYKTIQDKSWIRQLYDYHFCRGNAGRYYQFISQLFPLNETYEHPEYLDYIGLMSIYYRFDKSRNGIEIYNLFQSIKECFLEETDVPLHPQMIQLQKRIESQKEFHKLPSLYQTMKNKEDIFIPYKKFIRMLKNKEVIFINNEILENFSNIPFNKNIQSSIERYQTVMNTSYEDYDYIPLSTLLYVINRMKKRNDFIKYIHSHLQPYMVPIDKDHNTLSYLLDLKKNLSRASIPNYYIQLDFILNLLHKKDQDKFISILKEKTE